MYTHPSRWCGLREQTKVSELHHKPSCRLLVLKVITTVFRSGLPGCSKRARREGERKGEEICWLLNVLGYPLKNKAFIFSEENYASLYLHDSLTA